MRTSKGLFGASALAAALMVLASTVQVDASNTKGFAALQGKRLAGTTKAWLPIANPYTHPKDIGGSSEPPLITNDDSGGVAVTFFDFKSKEAATKFYDSPPQASARILVGLGTAQGYAPLLPWAQVPTGWTIGVPSPARDTALNGCVLSTNYELSGGKMNAAGKCSGSSTSVAGAIGDAIILRRGTVVVIASAIVGTTTLSIGPAHVTQCTPYALSAIKLLKKVGIK